MRITVSLPKLGDTTEAVVVLDWIVRVGAKIREGDPLVNVETDKIDADVPSPVTGILVTQLVQVGDEVRVGAAIAMIEQACDPGEPAARSRP